MEFFGNIIKGVMIGIANIIPGVSGGTMAVSLGIYDRLIGAVSGLFKEFKKNIAFLIPIIIGCGIGIVGFTYAIEYLLDKHTFVTCMAFVGLILGGLPAIISSMKSKMTSRWDRRVRDPGVCDRLRDLRWNAALKGEQGRSDRDRSDSGEYGDLIYSRSCGFCDDGDPGRIRIHDAHDLRILLRDHQYDQDIPRQSPCV